MININLRRLYKILSSERYYPLYILILSAFVLFFQLEGSVGGWDEAIYSEVAKESFLNNNWTDLYYKGSLWFEKPPFVIWLTIISFKIFGINEFAAWFFPALFGIMGVLGVYYLSKHLFNSKIGFLASLILLSIPHYLVMSRSNMTDIFLVSSSLMSFLFLIKSEKNKKYLLCSALFLGLAFMSKNVIALLNLPVFFYYLYINNRLKIFKSRYFYLSCLVFLTVVVPWHLIMFLRYGRDFFDSYILYHLTERFSRNILTVNYTPDFFYFFKVILEKTASWWFAFIIIILPILKDIKNRINYKELSMLLFWLVFILAFFSLSATKLHSYILPLYIPFSILIAYGLYNIYSKKSIFVLPLILVLFMNIKQSVILGASNSGESRLLFPLILHRFFDIFTGAVFFFTALLAIYILYNYFLKNKKLSIKILLCSIFIFSFLLPFYPDRSPIAKEIGDLSKSKNIETIFFYDFQKISNLETPLNFYNYPIKIVKLNQEDFKKIKPSKNSRFFCLINKTDFQNWHREKGLEYDFYPCEISR